VNIQKNLCEKVDILKHISELNISDRNKHNLIDYIAKSEQGEDYENHIFGMCLALQDEGKITPDDFTAITMREKKKRSKPSLRQRFWNFVLSLEE
jgi:hypothetical protein